MTTNNRLKRLTSKIVPHRTWIQWGFLLVWLDPLGWRLHSICSPVFHCYSCPLATFACPIGVLANFSALHLFPFVTVGMLVLIGISMGSIVCGWACPFGFLQDLAAKIPTPKFDPPRWTGHLRYVVLVGTVIAVPYFLGEGHWLFVCRFCPAGALEAAVPTMARQVVAGQKIVWPNALKLATLALFLIGVFLVKRPWCRILCPLGAIFSLFNRISAFFLRFDADRCNSCEQCHKLCEYGIEPDKSPNDLSCVRCLECTRCSTEALTLGSIFERPEETSVGPQSASSDTGG